MHFHTLLLLFQIFLLYCTFWFNKIIFYLYCYCNSKSKV